MFELGKYELDKKDYYLISAGTLRLCNGKELLLLIEGEEKEKTIERIKNILENPGDLLDIFSERSSIFFSRFKDWFSSIGFSIGCEKFSQEVEIEKEKDEGNNISILIGIHRKCHVNLGDGFSIGDNIFSVDVVYRIAFLNGELSVDVDGVYCNSEVTLKFLRGETIDPRSMMTINYDQLMGMGILDKDSSDNLKNLMNPSELTAEKKHG